MPEKIIKSEDGQVISHYGVLGMKWGVRRYRSRASRAGALVRKGLVGDESKSLATARGRRNFKSNVKADISAGKKAVKKVLDNKIFKTLIYDHKQFKENVAVAKKKVNEFLRGDEE